MVPFFKDLFSYLSQRRVFQSWSMANNLGIALQPSNNNMYMWEGGESNTKTKKRRRRRRRTKEALSRESGAESLSDTDTQPAIWLSITLTVGKKSGAEGSGGKAWTRTRKPTTDTAAIQEDESLSDVVKNPDSQPQKEQPAGQLFSLPLKAAAATYNSRLHPIGRDNHSDHRSAVCGQDNGRSHIETGKGDIAACQLKVSYPHTISHDVHWYACAAFSLKDD